MLVEKFNMNSRQLCNYQTDPCPDYKYACLLSLERCNCLRFELLLFLLIMSTFFPYILYSMVMVNAKISKRANQSRHKYLSIEA